MNDEQREGLGEALVDSLVEVWQSDDTVVIHADQIDPAIDAIAEYLWQRADDPEVVEAVAGALAAADEKYPYMSDGEVAGVANEALLTALLGSRPNGEEAADER